MTCRPAVCLGPRGFVALRPSATRLRGLRGQQCERGGWRRRPECVCAECRGSLNPPPKKPYFHGPSVCAGAHEVHSGNQTHTRDLVCHVRSFHSLRMNPASKDLGPIQTLHNITFTAHCIWGSMTSERYITSLPPRSADRGFHSDLTGAPARFLSGDPRANWAAAATMESERVRDQRDLHRHGPSTFSIGSTLCRA